MGPVDHGGVCRMDLHGYTRIPDLGPILKVMVWIVDTWTCMATADVQLPTTVGKVFPKVPKSLYGIYVYLKVMLR